MGRGTLLNQGDRPGRRSTARATREGGWSLVELTISLFVLMVVALFGMNTMVSGFTMENWSIGQSMTDAYAGIETAYAQRIVFNNIPGDGRWGIFPSGTTTTVTIGQTPFITVQARVTRTYSKISAPVTNAPSYLLESYVVYTSGTLAYTAGGTGTRTYCKVSKVYRSQ